MTASERLFWIVNVCREHEIFIYLLCLIRRVLSFKSILACHTLVNVDDKTLEVR